MKKKIPVYFLVCEQNDQTMTSGRVATGTVFQELRPGAGFKTGDLVKERLGGGGGIVERLCRPHLQREYLS